jgi:restriction system protein
MPVPDFQSLMLPVLRAAAGGDISSSELRERIAAELHLSADDLAEMLPSRRAPTFANRVAWATFFLQRAGLLGRVSRGVYRITDAGRQVLAEQPDRVDMRSLERFPAYVEWRQSSAAGASERGATPVADVATTQTPEEQIDASFKSLGAALEEDLVERVRERPPAFFERLIMDLLIAMGYGGGRAEMGEVTGRSGDGGIDGWIKIDALGTDVVHFQAKRYAEGNTVGSSEVQSFAGSLDGVGATKGIFVTTSTFSKGAREFAQRIAKKIVLIDGSELARLMIRHDVGVRTRETYKLKKADEDYFSE